MQEEVESRTVTLIINSSKLTANELRQALLRFLEYEKSRKNKKENTQFVKPAGKTKIKNLCADSEALDSAEVCGSLLMFDRTARKYGVQYAVRRDWMESPGKSVIIFRAEDRDILRAALKDYADRLEKLTGDRPSVLKLLEETEKQINRNPVKIRNKYLQR